MSPTLVRAKLDFLLAEAKGRPEPPQFRRMAPGTRRSLGTFVMTERSNLALLDATEWDDIPSLAEAAPAAFLQCLWPWYVSVFSEILARKDNEGVEHIYPGRYVLEIELTPSKARSVSREKPMISALQIAVEELAERSLKEFLKWADTHSNVEMLAVQQLIARGYEVASDQLASRALEWLLLDPRRFQLGTPRASGHDDRSHCASAPNWSEEEIGRFEKAVLSYRPRVPDHLKEPEQRRLFADLVRATKKDLLQAVDIERLTPENRELVATEQRALGNRFDRSIGEERRLDWFAYGSRCDGQGQGSRHP